jgi:hypothetical protein
MTLIGRGILRRLLRLHGSLVLLGHVTADQASGGCTQPTVAGGIMTGNAADNRSLDAAFCIGRCRRCGDSQCDGQGE